MHIIICNEQIWLSIKIRWKQLKNAVGKGAKAMMAKGNGKWEWFDEKIQNEMRIYIFLWKKHFMIALLSMVLKNF